MPSKQWYTMTYVLRHGWIWVVAGILVLVMVGLSMAYVRSTTSTGNPLFWPDKRATLNLRLLCPPSQPLQSPWGACWDDVARDAARNWNAAGSQFRFHFEAPTRPAQQSCDEPDFLNTVLWADRNCGMAFGDAIAITAGWNLADGTLGDMDVIFNNVQPWNAYTGRTQFLASGEPIYDLHRVAIHEFGHVLGLDHPDDYGQTVRAIMHSSGLNGTLERLQADDIAGVRAIYGAQTTGGGTTKGALGNPGHQTFKSGIGVISGWVCDANRVEVMIGTQRIRMAYGTERPDTAYAPDGTEICGDTNNGFVTLVNYNSLGDGVHTARLLVDGRQLGPAAEFKVTTFGQDFLRGAQGAYALSDFPRPGTNPIIVWDQGSQNFAIGGFE